MKRRVLVLDDCQDARTILMRNLERRFGCEVVQVCSVKAALEALMDRQFSCIVSDIDMPTGSGFDFANALDAQRGSWPLFFYTSAQLRGIPTKWKFVVGAVRKPNINELIGLIARHLGWEIKMPQQVEN